MHVPDIGTRWRKARILEAIEGVPIQQPLDVQALALAVLEFKQQPMIQLGFEPHDIQ
jgi:hypothetical protein